MTFPTGYPLLRDQDHGEGARLMGPRSRRRREADGSTITAKARGCRVHDHGEGAGLMGPRPRVGRVMPSARGEAPRIRMFARPLSVRAAADGQTEPQPDHGETPRGPDQVRAPRGAGEPPPDRAR